MVSVLYSLKVIKKAFDYSTDSNKNNHGVPHLLNRSLRSRIGMSTLLGLFVIILGNKIPLQASLAPSIRYKY